MTMQDQYIALEERLEEQGNEVNVFAKQSAELNELYQRFRAQAGLRERLLGGRFGGDRNVALSMKALKSAAERCMNAWGESSRDYVSLKKRLDQTTLTAFERSGEAAMRARYAVATDARDQVEWYLGTLRDAEAALEKEEPAGWRDRLDLRRERRSTLFLARDRITQLEVAETVATYLCAEYPDEFPTDEHARERAHGMFPLLGKDYSAKEPDSVRKKVEQAIGRLSDQYARIEDSCAALRTAAKARMQTSYEPQGI